MKWCSPLSFSFRLRKSSWFKYSFSLHFIPSVFILPLFATLFFGCENDIRTIKLLTDQKKVPVDSGKDLEIFYSDSARVKVKIKTPQLDKYIVLRPYTEMPKGVHVEFYNDRQEVSSTLKAKYAIRYDNERMMEARNDVVVVNVKGERLNTEYLVWDEKTAKISSPDFVKITTANEIIYGEGFEANQDFSTYKIFNIKADLMINKDANAKNP